MTPHADALIIGTAGHIDHGKTTLVKALTGVDLDTLPEEKERGITIALGFASLTLEDGGVVGIVDVPGHERFVRTMVAGASGLDAVMLCVSGVEGVMPQTREHLDILGLLGVKSGILVVTMADLVDAELLELAIEEIREQVRGTFLEGAPAIATSALTGVGLPELRRAIGRLERRSRVETGPFRMPVDRSFARRGFGTVVTGTAWSGQIAEGAEVEITPGGGRARLRSAQVHGAKVGTAAAGSRTALNLSGIDVSEVPRGTWVTSLGATRPSQVIDVEVRWLGDTTAEERTVLVLHGTAEVDATILSLDGDLAQLRLAAPISCLPGDRFVLRQASPAGTLGGGRVLDPFFSVAKRGRAMAGVRELQALQAGEPRAWLHRADVQGMDLTLAEQLGVTALGARLGQRVYSPEVAARLADALLQAVGELHVAHPLAMFVNRKEAQRGVLRELGEEAFQGLVDALITTGELVANQGVRLPAWKVTPTADQEAWLQETLRSLEAAAVSGVGELAAHVDTLALVRLLEDRGQLVRIGEQFYARSALDNLVALVASHFETHKDLDPAGFKTLTGHTRRTAIPLLEWLDKSKVTRRVGDVRVSAQK